VRRSSDVDLIFGIAFFGVGTGKYFFRRFMTCSTVDENIRKQTGKDKPETIVFVPSTDGSSNVNCSKPAQDSAADKMSFELLDLSSSLLVLEKANNFAIGQSHTNASLQNSFNSFSALLSLAISKILYTRGVHLPRVPEIA